MDQHAAILNVLEHNPSFNYSQFFGYHNPQFLSTAFLFFLIPALFQRISMAQNTFQLSKVFYISGFFIICYLIFLDY